MSYEWAPITWIFLHSFSHRVDEEYFNKNKRVCFNIIRYICQNLPCPICFRHATAYLDRNNIYICKTKTDFIRYLWIFHNNVNFRLGKPIYTLKNLEKYTRCNFHKICTLFFMAFEKQYVFTATMSGWMRRNATKNLKTYFNYHWKYYS